MTVSQRMHGLDFLRAVMMSLGVVLHSAQLYLVNPVVDYYWDPVRSLSMDVLLVFINTYRMPVFFLLSGFFTAMLLYRHGAQVMLENRYRRIVIPFLIFLPTLALIMTILRIIAQHVMITGELGFDLDLIENPQKLWDNTHNLWFLYYLTLHIGTVWLILKLWPKIPLGWRLRIHSEVTESPSFAWRIFLTVCICLAALGSTSGFGRISASLSFLPVPSVYLYFGLCFAFGWCLYQRLNDLELLAKHWPRNMLAANALFLVALVTLLTKGEPGSLGYIVLHILLSLSTGFAVGYYMLAFVGLFSRHFQNYSPWIRYFSDSSYWIFVFHSVPLVILAVPLYGWDVPAEIKFLVVCIRTYVICIMTYQLFVRNGRIGKILNGRRYETVPWRK